MQYEAERKNKGYRCLIYCSQPITAEKLFEVIDNQTKTCHIENGCCCTSTSLHTNNSNNNNTNTTNQSNNNDTINNAATTNTNNATTSTITATTTITANAKTNNTITTATTSSTTTTIINNTHDHENSICGLNIIQKTPLRVLHRRTLLDRPRVIHNLKTTYVNSHFFILDLITTAGKYITVQRHLFLFI